MRKCNVRANLCLQENNFLNQSLVLLIPTQTILLLLIQTQLAKPDLTLQHSRQKSDSSFQCEHSHDLMKESSVSQSEEYRESIAKSVKKETIVLILIFKQKRDTEMWEMTVEVFTT